MFGKFRNLMRLVNGSIIALFLSAVEPVVAASTNTASAGPKSYNTTHRDARPIVRCHTGDPLLVNQAHQFDGLGADTWLPLSVPAPGVLVVQVLVPSAASMRAEVEFLTEGCDHWNGVLAHANFLREIPNGLALSIASPGMVWIGVKSQNPPQPLRSLSIHTAFSTGSQGIDEHTWPAADPPQACLQEAPSMTDGPLLGDISVILTEIVDERDCDVLELTSEVGGLAWFEVEGAELETQLFAGDRCIAGTNVTNGRLGKGKGLTALIHPATYRMAIDPANGFSGSYDLKLRFYDLCSTNLRDDHGDTPLCATPIEPGSLIEGELEANVWGDEDFFTFQIEESRTLIVSSSGLPEGAHLTLLDATGRRLFENHLCERKGPTSEAGTLPAGRYYIRIESNRAATGSYSLSIELSS